MRASDLNLKNPTFRSLARLSELLPYVHAPMLCTIGVGQTKFRQFTLVKKYGLLIKREVHKQAEKEQGQYLAILTEQSWLIKDLPNFSSCGTQREIPSGQDSGILPAHAATHIIRENTTLLSLLRRLIIAWQKFNQ